VEEARQHPALSLPEGAATPDDIAAAARAIAGTVRRTPVLECEGLSERLGVSLHLKLETLQRTGSFKLRGAANLIRLLSPGERARGVVTVSTGNHGRAVAYAARAAGVRAVVCLPELVPADKVEAIRALGAEVRRVGRSQDEAEVEAERLAAEEGMVMIHPFDDPAIIAGQGTLGLEIVDKLPAFDLLLVPVSGGGLASGTALAVRARLPGVRVVGVSMARGAAMAASLKAGRPVEVVEEPSLADSLVGGIGADNRWTLALCRELLDDLVLLSEEEIAEGMRALFREAGIVAEGGGAVGVAALLAGKVRPAPGSRVVAVVSGRNVAPDTFAAVLAGGLPF
jgi:threonine dehydratase